MFLIFAFSIKFIHSLIDLAETTIDSIMTNTFLQAEVSSDIIKTEITDHSPIFTNMNINKGTIHKERML